MSSTRSPRRPRSPRRTVTASVLAGLLAAGLALVALPAVTTAAAWADDAPSPVESEPPGGATCLPGGPTTGCAPETGPSPSAGHASHTPTASPTPHRSRTTTRSKPPAAAPDAPRTHKSPKAATARSKAVAAGDDGSTGGVAGSGKSSSAKTDRAKSGASTKAGGAAASPEADHPNGRGEPSATSVAYALPDDPTPPTASSGAPAWVAPVVTMLLVLLAVVLVVGPARRRAGLASHR